MGNNTAATAEKSALSASLNQALYRGKYSPTLHTAILTIYFLRRLELDIPFDVPYKESLVIDPRRIIVKFFLVGKPVELVLFKGHVGVKDLQNQWIELVKDWTSGVITSEEKDLEGKAFLAKDEDAPKIRRHLENFLKAHIEKST